MFYVIKDDKIYEYGDKINSAWSFPHLAKEFKNLSMKVYEQNQDKYEIRNGELVDISETEIYLKIVAEKDKAKRISEIKEELEKLDLKCIRALREGGNALDGTPYLEKYQAEINILRDELNSLG